MTKKNVPSLKEIFKMRYFARMGMSVKDIVIRVGYAESCIRSYTKAERSKLKV